MSTIRINLYFSERGDTVLCPHLQGYAPEQRAARLKELAYAGLLLEQGRLKEFRNPDDSPEPRTARKAKRAAADVASARPAEEKGHATQNEGYALDQIGGAEDLGLEF